MIAAIQTECADAKGKVRRTGRREDVKTPLAKLKSLPDAAKPSFFPNRTSGPAPASLRQQPSFMLAFSLDIAMPTSPRTAAASELG